MTDTQTIIVMLAAMTFILAGISIQLSHLAKLLKIIADLLINQRYGD